MWHVHLSVSQAKKLQLIQLVWALQEFSARNCELVPLRGISFASGERLAALAFRLRRTLAPSALTLALRARFSSRRASGARIWVNCLESSLWQRLHVHVTVIIFRTQYFVSTSSISVRYRFPFPILRFYRKITLRYSKSVSEEKAFTKSKNPSAFFLSKL